MVNFAELKRRQERAKAHHEIPDGLNIGTYEQRNGGGELMIFFAGSPTTVKSAYVVLGKYAKPLDDGRQFYVADRTHKSWADRPITTYHEDLLMAVSWIVELKNQYEERKYK